jgi:predicted dehydrogenase
MGFTSEECRNIYAEATKPGAIFQIGHQYRYAPWVRAAVEEVKKGKIGEPTHVYAYWHRNNSWRHSVPSPDPGGTLERLINWRLYRETSGGLVTELGSHHIDIANWVFDGIPERATGMTSIVRYHDGRTVGDNVQAVFSYPGGRRLMFSSLTDNAKMGNELWIYGTEGSVAITIEDATFYYEPKAHPNPAVTGEEVVMHGITTGASYSTKGEMPYRGPGEKLAVSATEDPTLTACRAFIECVRTNWLRLCDCRGDCQSRGVRGAEDPGSGIAGVRTGEMVTRRRWVRKHHACAVAATMLSAMTVLAQDCVLQVRVDWSTVDAVSHTIPTLQVVVNPQLRRGARLHDGAFDALRRLGADDVRYVRWLPHPRLDVAELEPPADGKDLMGLLADRCDDGGFHACHRASSGGGELQHDACVDVPHCKTGALSR